MSLCSRCFYRKSRPDRKMCIECTQYMRVNLHPVHNPLNNPTNQIIFEFVKASGKVPTEYSGSNKMGLPTAERLLSDYMFKKLEHILENLKPKKQDAIAPRERGLSSLETATTDEQRLSLFRARSVKAPSEPALKGLRTEKPHVYLDSICLPGTPSEYVFIKHGSTRYDDDDRNNAYKTANPKREGIIVKGLIPAKTLAEQKKLEQVHRSFMHEFLDGTSVTQTGEVFYLNGARKSTLVKAFNYATQKTTQFYNKAIL